MSDNAPYEYKELPNKWWMEQDWMYFDSDEEETQEPGVYKVLHDFIINKVIPCAKCVELSGRFVPRVITLEVIHPKKEEPEYARIILSPTDVAPGIPNVEPDLYIHIRYYDFVRSLMGVIDIMQPLFEGHGWILGNTTASIDLKDLLDAANGKEVVERPKCWPVGHP